MASNMMLPTFNFILCPHGGTRCQGFGSVSRPAGSTAQAALGLLVSQSSSSFFSAVFHQPLCCPGSAARSPLTTSHWHRSSLGMQRSTKRRISRFCPKFSGRSVYTDFSSMLMLRQALNVINNQHFAPTVFQRRCFYCFLFRAQHSL